MRKVEFLIVGKGLAGIMLAFEMIKHGMDFMMVAAPEKKGASEVAAGMFNPLVFKRLTLSWMADQVLPVMKEQFNILEYKFGKHFYYEKDIIKPLSEQEAMLWVDKAESPSFSKYIKSILNDRPSDVNIAPSPAYGIVKGSGYIDLSSFLETITIFLEEQKLLHYAEVNYNTILKGNDTYEVDGIKARSVIFCDGAYMTNNPYFRFVRLVPVKGEILQLHIPGFNEEYILNKYVFVIPVGNDRFKVGSTYDWQDLTWSPTPEGKQSLLSRMGALIQARYKIESHLAGIRPATSDRRPVLGAHPKYKNMWLFNGLGTKGVMLAPYFAGEMIRLLTEKDYKTVPEADLNRFRLD